LQAAAELWLAKAYRKLGKYLEAEAHAHEAISAADELDRWGVDLTQDLTGLVGDDRWPLWVILALAHMQIAGCHTDRDGDVEHASDALAAADSMIHRIKGLHEFDWRDADDVLAEYQAETGRLLLVQDKAEEAIDALRASADLDPDEADIYLLLARAHARAAEKHVEAEWQAHIRHAREACRRARRIGGEGHPDSEGAIQVEEQLARIEAVAAGASDGSSGDGKAHVEAPAET
jgi:tetratricopeptide (TPR) repeat protein